MYDQIIVKARRSGKSSLFHIGLYKKATEFAKCFELKPRQSLSGLSVKHDKDWWNLMFLKTKKNERVVVFFKWNKPVLATFMENFERLK